jgi:hypothetical protein
MKIKQILDEIKFVDRDLPISCSIVTDQVNSNIYVVGKVRLNTPGVVLGNREPYLREKTVGSFITELKTFGESCQHNDFLFQHSVDLSNRSYEFRFYKLTKIILDHKKVLFVSTLGELIELREQHEQPELE